MIEYDFDDADFDGEADQADQADQADDGYNPSDFCMDAIAELAGQAGPDPVAYIGDLFTLARMVVMQVVATSGPMGGRSFAAQLAQFAASVNVCHCGDRHCWMNLRSNALASLADAERQLEARGCMSENMVDSIDRANVELRALVASGRMVH